MHMHPWIASEPSIDAPIVCQDERAFTRAVWLSAYRSS